MRAPNQPDTVTVQDWRSLQLDIQVRYPSSHFTHTYILVTEIEPSKKHDSVLTIEDALKRISHLQPVQLDPSGFSEASQQVLIETVPPVLVLHLKRFLYDVAEAGMVKISKPIQFAPELEIPVGAISSFIFPVAKAKKTPCPEILAPVAGKSAEPVHYRLYGVLYHHGKSAGGGHYTVDVLHRNGDGGTRGAWLHVGDEVVSVVRPEDVFGSGDDEWLDDRCAYILIYCCTAPTQT